MSDEISVSIVETDNIAVEIQQAPAPSAGGNVDTVNGVEPDENKNVQLSYNDLDDLPTIPDELSDLSDDATHRLVTDTEKGTWNGKQDALGFTPENSANKGNTNGYASLGADGLVPSEQLPTSSVDFTSDQNILVNQIFS